MNKAQQVSNYLNSWYKFRRYCELKAKNRCELNNNSWRKLEEWHLEDFLNKIDNPFGFLYKLKIFNPEVYYRTQGINNQYNRELSNRQQLIQGRKY